MTGKTGSRIGDWGPGSEGSALSPQPQSPLPHTPVLSSDPYLTENCIFRFSDHPEMHGDRRTLVMSPQRAYKPYTVLVWGAKAETVFRTIIIDGDDQLRTKIPGCLFEAEIPFDEFESLLLRRPDWHSAIIDLDRLGQFFRFDMPAVPAGGRIEVEVEGGYDQAVFIGRMERYASPLEVVQPASAIGETFFAPKPKAQSPKP